jgi:hypothetical protein
VNIVHFGNNFCGGVCVAVVCGCDCVQPVVSRMFVEWHGHLVDVHFVLGFAASELPY